MNERDADDETVGPGDYCRRIEAYLCQKNGGHLIRLVGPAFETVCRWEAQGVPLKLAFRGIDRYFERDYAKGTRRRPVRIEFCEADVLDAFDQWRRAVGVPAGGGDSSDARGSDGVGAPRRGPALTGHLDRVLLKLTSFLAGARASSSLRDLVERDLRELDAMRHGARGLRGAAREGALARLRELDEAMMSEAVGSASPEMLAQLRSGAAAELAAFRGRMPDAAWDQALETAARRALRERLGLPRLALE